MGMQLYGNQIKAGEINQAHHARFGGHVAHVSYSHVRNDALDSPPGSETAGDTFIVGSTPSGDWSTFSTGNIVQAIVDSPASVADWQLLAAAMTTGRKLIVNATGLGGSFTGHANAMAEKTGAGLADYTFQAVGADYDGQQVVQIGHADDVFANVTHLWNNVASAWAVISDVVEIGATDNALEYDQGKLSHKTTLGHSWSNRYNRGIVMGTKDTEPAAAVGYSWIVTTGGTWDGLVVSVNDIIYCKNAQAGLKFVKIGTRIAGELLAVPPAGTVGDFVGKENKIVEWVSGSTWIVTTPKRGDLMSAGTTELNAQWNIWAGDSFEYNGVSWGTLAKDPAEVAGTGLAWDSATRTLIPYLTANGGLSTNGGLHIDPTASGTAIGATNPVADKKYVDDVAAYGVHWKNPALVLKMTNDSAQSGADPDPTTRTGQAWVVNNWLTMADGDIVESDGVQWNVILAASGGEPPDGSRAIVTGATAAGSFATKENQIATYDADTDTWSFEVPTDGDAVLINGELGIYENQGYVFDTSAWVGPIFGPGSYTAGFGLNLSGGIFSLDYLTANATKTSGTTWDTGLASTVDGDRMMIFRNGILQKKVASGPADGEYTWSAGTATFYTAFNANGEYCYAFGPGV